MNPIKPLLLLVFTVLAPQLQADTCGAEATAISQVQGAGDQSPLAGEQVTVEAIITLDSRQPGGFSGFYLQQADHQTDSDPRTSEALFVYTRKKTGAPGQRVRVRGRVKEYHGLTELVDIRELQDCGKAPLPEAVPLTLPWPDDTRPESLENMRVSVDGKLTVIDTYNLARYGELTLAPQDQLTPTQVMPPGPEAMARHRQQQHQRMRLDDGLSRRHPEPAPWSSPGDSPLRAGSQVSGLTGVLDYRFRAWRLQPSAPPRFHNSNPRAEAPPRPTGSNLRVLFLNLENHFNGNGQGGGFGNSRGPGSAAAYQQQTRRLVSALTAPDPDILAVAELENDGYGPHSALAGLARALGPDWRFVGPPQGGDGGDAIRTALLYRHDRVVAEGKAVRLTSAPFQRRGRPPIAQVFRLREGRQQLRVIVPHLKSKACRGARGADTDQQDGQGCYARTRQEAARALIQWADSLPQPQRLAGTLITGDLNSYAREDSLQQLAEAGYRDMVRHFAAAYSPHSYRYKGRRGTLDYSLASPGLQPAIGSAQTWSINADEPPMRAYDGPSPAPPDSPWRASDHDPVITDLKLR